MGQRLDEVAPRVFDDCIDFVVVPSLESIACNIFATKQGLEFGVWEWGHQHALWDVHRHTYNAKQKNISRPSLAAATLPGVIRAVMEFGEAGPRRSASWTRSRNR